MEVRSERKPARPASSQESRVKIILKERVSRVCQCQGNRYQLPAPTRCFAPVDANEWNDETRAGRVHVLYERSEKLYVQVGQLHMFRNGNDDDRVWLVMKGNSDGSSDDSEMKELGSSASASWRKRTMNRCLTRRPI